MMTFDFLELLYHPDPYNPVHILEPGIQKRIILFKSTYQWFKLSETNYHAIPITPAQHSYTPNELIYTFKNTLFHQDNVRLNGHLIDLKYFDLTPTFYTHFIIGDFKRLPVHNKYGYYEISEGENYLAS